MSTLLQMLKSIPSGDENSRSSEEAIESDSESSCSGTSSDPTSSEEESDDTSYKSQEKPMEYSKKVNIKEEEMAPRLKKLFKPGVEVFPAHKNGFGTPTETPSPETHVYIPNKDNKSGSVFCIVKKKNGQYDRHPPIPNAEGLGPLATQWLAQIVQRNETKKRNAEAKKKAAEEQKAAAVVEETDTEEPKEPQKLPEASPPRKERENAKPPPPKKSKVDESSDDDDEDFIPKNKLKLKRKRESPPIDESSDEEEARVNGDEIDEDETRSDDDSEHTSDREFIDDEPIATADDESDSDDSDDEEIAEPEKTSPMHVKIIWTKEGARYDTNSVVATSIAEALRIMRLLKIPKNANFQLVEYGDTRISSNMPLKQAVSILQSALKAPRA